MLDILPEKRTKSSEEIACYGGPSEMCDGAGIMLYEVQPGVKRLVCRLHYYQHSQEDTRCDARLLVDVQADLRVRCESPWRHIYKTSQKEYKRLCGLHYAFTDYAKSRDERLQGGAA